jgi:hypothetical protein
MKYERGLSIATWGAEDDALAVADEALQSGELLGPVTEIGASIPCYTLRVTVQV